MRRFAIIAIAGLALPQIGLAKPTFISHGGASEVLRGKGGDHANYHGVEVWTRGMPTRPFKVIGTINDIRTDKFFAGDATQSASLAKLVRQHGGDAALVRGVKKDTIGEMPQHFSGPIDSVGFTSSKAVPVKSVTTTFAVIKYAE